jgi:hypothetical protein
MRKLCAAIAAACFVTSAITQDDPFLKGEELQAEIRKSCAEGCVTFNREEAADFEARLQMLVAGKQAEAYQMGVQAQKAACASLI